MIDMLNDGVDTRFFIRGGFAEINATQITVLAEEAIPMTELDLAVLDQRIKDAQEDEIAAKTDADRPEGGPTGGRSEAGPRGILTIRFNDDDCSVTAAASRPQRNLL